MKKKVILAILTIAVAATLGGCGKKNRSENNDTTQQAEVQNEDDKNEAETDKTKSESVKADAIDDKAIYEEFLAGKGQVYFDKYFENRRREYKDTEYVRFEENKAYSFGEFIDAVVAHTACEEAGGLRLDEVQYAYIDCGMDEVPELALRFPNVEEWGSLYTYIYVIKNIDNKLQVCYVGESSYRSNVDVSTNGLIDYDGAGGAAVEYYEKAFIDKDGNTQLIYELEKIYGVYNLYLPNMYNGVEYAEELGIADTIVTEGYTFDYIESTDDYSDVINNRIYTYYRTDDDYYIVEDDPSIYKEGSPYYEYMKATDLNTMTPNKLETFMSGHKAKIGYTDKLEEGDFPRWTTFYHANIVIEPEPEVDNCQYVEVRNPSWEYYSKVDYDPRNLPITLTQESKVANDITDDDAWLDSIGKNGYNPNYCEDEYYEYYLSGDLNYEPYIIDIYNKYSGEHEAHLDMSDFTIPPTIETGSEPFVNEAVRCVQYSDGLFYVQMNHRTYASSAPQNAYIMALDPSDGYSVVWKSQPLVGNALNFQIEDNTIICGYGFTAEPDFIYLLDKHSGVQMDVYKVKTGPDYFFVIDGKLYVRTYDTNYVFKISFG